MVLKVRLEQGGFPVLPLTLIIYIKQKKINIKNLNRKLRILQDREI